MTQTPNSLTATAFQVMDEAQAMLLDGEIPTGMNYVILELNKLRISASPQLWQDFSRQQVFQHSLVNLTHQDPFTYHTFSKPRGYAGDAEMMDRIYGFYPLPDDVTPLGKEIFNYTINTPAPQSVRSRRHVLAEAIDNTAKPLSYPPHAFCQ